MKPLWLAFHFPQLLLDYWLVKKGNDRSAVVYEPSTKCVMQVNQLGHDKGIRVGDSLAAVASLDETCRLWSYDEEKEKFLLQLVAEKIYQHASDIYLFDAKTLVIQASCMLKFYQSLTVFCRCLQGMFDQYQFSYLLGTGSYRMQALMSAYAGSNELVLEPDAQVEFLEAQSLVRMPVFLEEKDVLQRIGVHSFGQLSRLPLKELRRRFSAEFIERLLQVQGQVPDHLTKFFPADAFIQCHEFSHEIEHLEGIVFSLKRTLQALEDFCYLRQQGARQIKLYLRYRERLDSIITVNTQQVEYRADEWLLLFSSRLEQYQLEAPVVGFKLEVTQLEYITPSVECDLFSKQAYGVMEAQQFVSRLKNDLGEERVLSMVVNEDHRPEKAYQLRPYTHVRSSSHADWCHAQRPVWLLDHPQTLVQQVELLEGPERIQTGWWDNDEVCRDYYIAENGLGQTLWVFRRADGVWFVHGLFS